MESSLLLRKLDVWMVESLSYLAARSLDEDAYGVVQRDVPRILESFVSFLSALETFSQEIQKDVSEARSTSKPSPRLLSGSAGCSDAQRAF